MDIDMAKFLMIVSFIALVAAFLTVPSLQQFGRLLLTSSENIPVPGGPPGSLSDSSGEGELSLNIVTLLGFDAIPAILAPTFVPPEEAERWLDANEQVLGVSIHGESHAYSNNMLSRHEIVNYVVGGVPIAVTW